MEVLPGRLAEAVVAHDERGAGIELLVLQVAAGELGADQVPGQLVELHALERAELRRLPVFLEQSLQVLVVHHRDVGRHLEDAAAEELAQRVDDHRLALGAPVERRIHVAAACSYPPRTPTAPTSTTP